MNLEEARKRIPELAGLSDESAMNVIHEVYYPSMDKAQLAERLGYKAPPPPKPERSTARAVGDVGLSLGQGAVGAFKALADLGGADNAVSQGLGDMSKFLGEQKSEQSQATMAASQARIQAAEESGSTMEEVKAYMGMLWDQPAEMLAQGVGSFATMGLGKAASALKLAGAAKAAGVSKAAFLASPAGRQAIEEAAKFGFKANIGIGAGMGVGAVKGSQYEQTEQNALKQGMSPEDAQALAAEAQRYGGPGTMQQVLGGGLGALAAATGPVERLIMGRGVGQAGMGTMASMGKGFLVEGSTEGAQGAQERFAGNTAAIDAGVLDPSKRMQGVAGQFTMEGAIGGVIGAAAGPFDAQTPVNLPQQTPGDAIRSTELVPEGGPMTRAANVATEAKAQSADAMGASLTGTDPAAMMGGATDPLANIIGDARNNDAASFNNIQQAANNRPPMPASDAARILEEAKARDLDFTAAPHPDGGFVVVPRAWVTPAAAAKAETEIAQTLERMRQADAAPVQRAPRTGTTAQELDLTTDPVTNYVNDLRQVNTPAAKLFVRDFDAGSLTADDVRQRMEAERTKTPDERLAAAAAEGLRMNPKGDPFKTMMAAQRAAKQNPGEVVEVQGGYAIRQPQESASDPIETTAGPTDAGSSSEVPPTGAAEQGALNVQDAPQPAAGTQAQAAPGEAPAPAGRDAAATGGVPAAPGAGDVQADGVTPAWADMTPDQRKRARLEQEIATGKTNNGGVIASLRPSAIEKRKQELAQMGDAGRLSDPSVPDAGAGAGVRADGVKVSTGKMKVHHPSGIPPYGGGIIEVDAQPVQIKSAPAEFEYVAYKQGNNTWRVVEKTTGLAIADSIGKTLREAVAKANKYAGAVSPEIFRKAVADSEILNPNQSAADPSKNQPKIDTSAEPAQETAKNEQVKKPTEPAKTEPFDHAGLKIRQTRTKVGNEVVDGWLVQSPENAEREARGERQIGGDRIVETREQAVKTAEQEVKRAKDERARKDALDREDADRKAATEARKEANRGKTLLERRAEAALDKQIRESSTGDVITRREWVERRVKEGLEPKVTQEDKIKPMSRMQAFRADNRQQAEHDKKVKEAGKKDVYWLGDFEITKTEYDYVQKVKVRVADGAETQAPAETDAQRLERFRAEFAKEEPGTPRRRDLARDISNLEKLQAAPKETAIDRRNRLIAEREAQAPTPEPAPEPQARPAPTAGDPLFEQKNTLRQLQNTLDAGVDPQGGPLRADRRASYEKSIKDLQAEIERVVKVPPAVTEAIEGQMQKQKNRIARLKREAEANGMTLDEKRQAHTKVKAAETTLRKMRQTVFDAEDAAIKALASGNAADFAQHADLFSDAAAVIEAQAKPAAPAAAPAKADALSEREKAAKAKMMAAAGKLADLLGKNTRATITPEQEQKLLPIVIELFDGAMELGFVKFKQAARYVREFIAQAIDQDAADSIPIDTLQGAYIATARRHTDKDITPKAEVVAVDSVAELDEPADQADTTQEPTREDNAAPLQPQDVPAGDSRADEGDDAPGAGDRQSVGTGLAAGDTGPVQDGQVSGSPESAGASGTRDPEPAGQQPSRPARDRAGVRPESEPADFVIDANEIGKGGLTKKYRDNVAAIRVLKAMEAEGRPATPEERKALSKYAGWGAMKGPFDPANKQWAKQHAELNELLTPDEFRAARKSTLDAHYTSPVAVGAMNDALERLGYKGGRMLEPSVGVGNFYGLMPAAVRKASQLYGVELDSLTSRMVAALYPKAKIAKATGFEDFDIPSEFFDLVQGNPPFGSQPLVDAQRSPYSGFSIHNYFLAKGIDKLRPGGLMEVVVSHNFLDAMDTRARQWIGARANLIGAVRLPDTAFKENAGTDVVTDILIFQKKTESEWANGLGADVAPWQKVVDQVNVNPKTGESVTHRVNELFVSNPQLVLGTPSAGGSQYAANQYTVEATGDIKAQLADWVKTLPENVYQPIKRAPEVEVDMAVPDGVKVGSFYVDPAGEIRQRGEDVMGNKTATSWAPANAKAAERMKGMIALRETLRSQMRLERSLDASTADIEANRATLNKLYDDFLKKHGHLNNQVNRRLFLDDTEAQLLQALEFDFDKGVSKAVAEKDGIEPREPTATKADIFERRVAFPPQDFLTVTTAKDALLASLNYRGKVDSAYMSEVYGKPADKIIEELGDVVFDDPQQGIVTADEYLSGDVKTKLAEAKAAGPQYRRNVQALEKVIPVDKKPSEINVSIGAAFVPAGVYEQFVHHISGGNSTAAYVKATGQWLMNFSGGADAALNTGKFGTDHLSAQELFQLTMLGRGAVVKRTTRNADGSTTTVLMEKETEAAREKQNAIKAEWQTWLWGEPTRADAMANLYNDKLNRIVERKYDGSHLSFPGMNPGISLLEHQKNGVWRGLQSYQVLYDHVVGAGKTFEMATLAMEMRRLGIARKPLFIVPNHLTLQWRSEFTRLYPGSNILAATPEDFSAVNRERLFSKIITGDWDAVVIGHSSLKKIGLPEATEKAVLQEQIDEVAEAIESMKRGRGDRNIIRDMEGIRSRLEAKMKEKLAAIGNRSKVVTFDELGIDAMFIDEMHEFKNLTYNSTMDRNPGMGNPTGSGKAFDLFVKTRWMFDTFGEKAPYVTATGTPVSNSLVEMYNMQRYMQYPTLKAQGLHVFDAWAKQFGSVENVYEVAPSGSGYRQSTRFAKFTNLPGLMGLFNTFADTITLDDLKAQEEAQGKRFPVPKLVGGKPQIVVAKRSPAVANLMGVPKASTDEDGNIKFMVDLSQPVLIQQNKESGKWSAKVGDTHLGEFPTEEDARIKVVERAVTPDVTVESTSILGRFANLRQLTKESKGKVNALSLTGEANKAGLDYRLINPAAPDFPGSKINLAVDNMVRIYQQWAADKGAQLVFCDMSIPLSARASYSTTARRLYVRDDAGALAMKRGTMHTLEGQESLPYFVVQRGEKDLKRFDLYDAATGLKLLGDLRTKQDALDRANAILADENKRQRLIDARESRGEITQEAIDEYNNENDIEADGVESFTREDIAGVSGAAKFSVYDDIKAKLIAKGIPEREVAFIHDYSTPAAKDKLFKAVNAGDIRFLLGSTPKMGAGTNVQRRLVGLHHIDAPWRPSDLEQREGRIIRRGNDLYTRDPDGFEVFVGRYATEQTYDTRRWQILEHKARGIEQLRNFDGTINEIDDIEGEAANSADMKAAASGDPLILEETRLRNDVRRLEQLQAAHADDVLAMNRKARSNDRYAETEGPKQLAAISALRDAAKQHPLDKDGWSPVTVNDKKLDTKEAAQAELARVVNEVRAGLTDEATMHYRGVEFTVFRQGSVVTAESPTGNVGIWAAADPFSTSGFVQRLKNYVDRLDAIVDDIKASMQRAEKDADAMRAQAATPFAQAQALVDAREAYKKVQRALLAKGPAVPDEQKPAVAAATKAQKARLEELGFGEQLREFFSGKADDDVQFSRGKPAPGVPLKEAQAIANAITARWANAPDLVVVANMQDAAIPARVRQEDAKQRSQGASGEPEGFYYGGKVYVVASALNQPADVVRVLFHEALGHAGLRGVFGEGLTPILKQLAALRRAEVAAKAKQYGLDMNKEAERLQAAEEVLAVMAQTRPELGYVQRAIAAVRAFLRNHVPGFGKMMLTDAEIIQQFILPARRFVERGPGGGPRGGQPVPAFSRTNAGASGVADQIRQFDVAGKTGNTLKHYLGMALQALGRRQLVDLYQDYLPQLKKYDRLVQNMEAEKNDTGAEADGLARAWGSLDGDTKRKGEELKLAELMHDATLAKIDPQKDYQAGDDRGQWAALRAKFNALDPKAQALYVKARDMYADHYAKVRKAIAERIERSEMSDGQKKKTMARMDDDFFKKTKGVYFPLSRFGSYVMVVKDANGDVVNVSRAETLNEAETTRKELMRVFPRDGGFNVSKVLKDAEFNAGRDAVGKGFMADLLNELDKQGVDDALRDSVSQLYLASLPDLSWAKHGIHRKGTPGFSQDARRAFAQNMFHGARHLAKLRYSDRLQGQLEAMDEHIKAYREIEEYDSVKAQQVLDEMVKRHESLMNPKTNPLSTALTSVGFVFYLGISPAAAMVNLSQTALVAYPIMGAKWGFTKAGAALLRASKETVAAKNDISKVLQGDELAAYEKAVKDGTIDVTMAHDLAGISQGEDAKVTWALRPVMRAASFLFHHAERFNRQATFIASFRLAKEAGADNARAFEEAKKATYDGHFDYGAANRPRVMQGNVAKVVLLFKQYGQNMVYTLSRQAYLSMKGLTPADRAEARKQLSGILALHAAAAGALGLPLVGPLLAAASFLGGDDDEPWNAEVALKNALADELGPKAAEVLSHGLSRLTPWDISSRVALNKLILPDVREGLEGQDLAKEVMTEAVGPVGGIFVGIFKGLQSMSDGKYGRGFEEMLPVALRNPIKAIRFAEEGAVDKSGVVIKDEVSLSGVLGQASGFAPSEVRLATEGKSAIISYDRALMDRRQTLMAQFAQARMAGDTEGMADARKDIERFNSKNPARRITPANLIQSVRARQRRIDGAEQGVYLPKNRRDAMEAGRFAAEAAL